MRRLVCDRLHCLLLTPFVLFSMGFADPGFRQSSPFRDLGLAGHPIAGHAATKDMSLARTTSRLLSSGEVPRCQEE